MQGATSSCTYLPLGQIATLPVCPEQVGRQCPRPPKRGSPTWPPATATVHITHCAMHAPAPGVLPKHQWAAITSTNMIRAVGEFDSLHSGYVDWRRLALALAGATYPEILQGSCAAVARAAEVSAPASEPACRSTCRLVFRACLSATAAVLHQSA
jgi:hypothetical protein